MHLATGPGTDVYWRKVSIKRRAYDESVTFAVTDLLARIPAGRRSPARPAGAAARTDPPPPVQTVEAEARLAAVNPRRRSASA